MSEKFHSRTPGKKSLMASASPRKYLSLANECFIRILIFENTARFIFETKYNAFENNVRKVIKSGGSEQRIETHKCRSLKYGGGKVMRFTYDGIEKLTKDTRDT
ncbi:hypothetical protein TNCT_5231 [Trichonephila clavata]|uniref:Uncharacterized protein n=1 Tax=Trichonephila clavata TaxID=2740835 RepID=A0A8X6HYH5_TRICU|nr:hypothetical protein TNCT_5231 [Trichonephila clavata]